MIALNTIDIRADLDTMAKIHLIRRNSLDKRYQFQTISLAKPKYRGKESQEVKVV